MKVDIISKEHIRPSSPTPSHLKKFKLSFLDQLIPPSYVPLILYYSYDETRNITQADMSSRLKRSLSEALTQFYPLAGKMEGESSVDCNDDGVYYLETRVNSQLSEIVEFPEVEVVDHFIPYNLSGTEVISVEEQLAIQVNLFDCGGIALGICISHRIADASTLCTFIKGWAALSIGEVNLVRPIFDSSSLFPPGDSSYHKVNTKNPAIQIPVEKLVTRRFLFTASAIAALKADVSVPAQPTRVEALSALIWKCFIAATRVKEGTKSVAFHPVNLRGRMVPPLPENCFGNIFQMAMAVADGETDLTCLVSKLRGAFERIDINYINKLLGENGFEIVRKNFREIGELLSHGDVQLFRFTSWCRFPIYEADFGWGNPTWVSSASFYNKDSVFFMDSRLDGGIEAWVVLDGETMAKFERGSELLTYLSSVSGN